VFNFRDLGGYKAQGGRTIAWRRLFRSSELRHKTSHDIIQLKEDISLHSILDLRSYKQLEPFEVSKLNEVGAKYFNIPIVDRSKDNERIDLQKFSNMGEVYSYRIMNHEGFGRRVVEALEIIAESDTHPLVFHCTAGKDHSGMLTAIILGILGVKDEDIIKDYALTGLYMNELINFWNTDIKMSEPLKKLPNYFFEASPDSMALFLSTLGRGYGSARGYINAHGADVSLIHRLENALLI
jgi:protein-tyrosine phosphatase